MPLSELITGHSVKLEPVDQPVQLPDGTSVHNQPNLSQDCSGVKQEVINAIEINRHNREMHCFKCLICGDIFNTRYQFAVHVAQHEVRCVNCKCKYKTWKELENHEDYCTRRFGRILIPPREKKPAPKPNLKFKCCLCNRRYEKCAHLFDHQVKRCKKRYLKPQWVVKI